MLDSIVKSSTENLRSEIKRAMEKNHAELQAAADALYRQQPAALLAIPDIASSCEMILADQLLHTLSPQERDGLIAFIRSQQLPEGSWPDAYGVPNLNLSAFGTWALRCHADPADEAAIAKGKRCVLDMGGAQRGSFSLRLWLAISGAIPWSWLTAVPTHLWLLPESWPLSSGSLSLRSRSLLCAYHLLSSVEARLQLGDVRDLLAHSAEEHPVAPRITRSGLAGDLLQAVDRSIKFSRKRPRGVLSRQSTQRALTLAESIQDNHGAWVTTHPTILMCLALRAQGQHSHAAPLQRALEYLKQARGFAPINGAFAAKASEELANCGAERVQSSWQIQGLSIAPSALRYRLEHALDFSQRIGSMTKQSLQAMLDEELRWDGPSPQYRETPPGGWPSQADAHLHHDLWASCRALLRLSDCMDYGLETEAQGKVDYERKAQVWGARRRAGQVLLAMQQLDGTFARFSRHEQHKAWTRLPWLDAQGMQRHRDDDPFRASLSAQALLCLSQLGWRSSDDRIERGLSALEQLHQRHGTQWPLRTLSEVCTTVTQLLPAHSLFRKSIEQQLRRRQLENGSFGDINATAHALGALWTISQRQQKGLCAQGQRALHRLLDGMRQPQRPHSFSYPCTGAGLSTPAIDALQAQTTLQIVLGRIWASMS